MSMAFRLEEVEAFVAERPRMSALNSGKFERVSGIRPRSWEEAVQEHFRELQGGIAKTQ